MKHSVTVSVNQDGKRTKVVRARETTIREKLLTTLFGKKAKVMVITPYDTVSEIKITEEGGKADGAKRGLQFDCC